MSKNGTLFDPGLISAGDANKKTVAQLTPAATAGPGASDFVVDATSTTFAATAVGGGSNKVPVFCDGSVWKIG